MHVATLDGVEGTRGKSGTKRFGLVCFAREFLL
jgi:hypothetical protein